VNDDFSFKDLMVWQRAVVFTDQVIELTEKIAETKRHFRLIEQLESAVASISSNIAEGKGRYSKKEFVQFLFYARGSLFETISLLNVFKRRGRIETVDLERYETEGKEIGKMISGLINSIRSS
jgi:four helix bundle protein